MRLPIIVKNKNKNKLNIMQTKIYWPRSIENAERWTRITADLRVIRTYFVNSVARKRDIFFKPPLSTPICVFSSVEVDHRAICYTPLKYFQFATPLMNCYDIFTKIEIIYVVLYCIISLFVLGVSGRQTKLSNALIKEELW